MAVWYVRDNAPTSTLGWSAVTAWSNHTAVAGEIVRQLTTPAVGSERVFVCIVAGATGATEPGSGTWTVTKGAKNTSGSATYQECTGQPAVNGDLTNTPLSSTVRSTSPGLGKIILDNAGTHIFICSTSGAAGAGEPTYNTAAVGNTTADSSATWTYIGTSFSAWAAPFARLASALTATWGAAGDSVYIADDHSETQSTSISIGLLGTLASPNFISSIDHTASLPPNGSAAKSGATITTTAAGNISVSSGSGMFVGITFSMGTSTNANIFTVASTAGIWVRYENCTIKKLATTSSGATGWISHASSSKVELINTTVQCGNTADVIGRGGAGPFIWRNTPSAIQGATLPTTLFQTANNTAASDTIIEGVGLSALGSGKTLVAAGSASGGTYHFIDCELGASVTVAATPAAPGLRTFVSRSDSSGTGNNHQAYLYQGTQTIENAIVRTGGAADPVTGSGYSWKIVTTANSKWMLPFESLPPAKWNAVTGSNVTVTVFGIWGGGAVPNNDDIWIDVEYLGTSGAPLASLATGTKSNNVATGSPLTSDGTSSWGGSTTAFKMVITCGLLSTPQPQIAGYLRVYVKAAKASTTFYVDPLIVLS